VSSIDVCTQIGVEANLRFVRSNIFTQTQRGVGSACPESGEARLRRNSREPIPCAVVVQVHVLFVFASDQ
jgi:hypothetical protein